MESHHHCHHQQQASHHCHHQQQASHHCHHQQQASHDGSSCYCTCSSSPYQSQPQHSSTDPLLQALASQLLQQQQIFTHHYIHKPQKHHQSHHDQQQQALFGSLLRRIETLESSLHQLSPSPTITLRDLAARTIQTHFRAYLVRRSQTLRNLKHLAIIKSNFNSLKSSISNKPHFNPQSLSQKAINLLHKLDSIQGGDPMIRDGKRAISRDLVQFLEYIDGVLMKRQQLYSKSMKKVRFGGKNQESTSEDLDDQGGSSDDQREVMENLCKKIEGFSRVYEDVEEEPQIETDESSSSSSKLSNTGEGNSRNSLRSEVNSGNDNHCQGKNENLFSAPLPVQMEPIRDNLMKREKIVKVAR